MSLADTIAINGSEFPNTLSDDVDLRTGDLNGKFMSHPERFNYWATLYEMALHEEQNFKHELQRMYAKVDYNTRIEMKDAGMRVTEKMVENTVICHPKYTEVLEDYNQAKLQTGLLKAARDAMIHRRDMLIQLGATARAEGASDISIRQEAVKSLINNQ